MTMRARALLAAAVLGCAALVAAAQDAAGEAIPADQIEARLKKIEQVVDSVVKGRAELRAGMKDLLSKNKVSASDARALCESVGDQSKVVTLVGGQIALLERNENQKSMSAKQRARLAKARATLDQTPPKVDCSAF